MPNLNLFERSISKARLDSYRVKGGTEAEVFSRYLWNVALCEALYPSLQILEVALRNSIHREMAAVTGAHNKTPDWLVAELAFLYPPEIERIKQAKESLGKMSKPVTEALLVSELSFGFWTSLLDSRYDKMWPKIIASVFPGVPRKDQMRNNLSPQINRIRKLRNAALHHHSIWHWADLPKQHAEVLGSIAWICPTSSALNTLIDRFPTVHAGGEAQFVAAVTAVVP